jgi:DNA-binding XRE family transcriptional regulator
MSPRKVDPQPVPAVLVDMRRASAEFGIEVRDARHRRGWSVPELARRAGLSPEMVYRIEAGQPGSSESQARLAVALGRQLRVGMVDPRQRAVERAGLSRDVVHSAMGEFEAGRLRRTGAGVGIDEPYQHFQFAGRADLLAWTVEHRALLHVENRTRFPDLQKAAGSYNAKRSYLPGVFAQRIGLRGGFVSVTHVVAALWSAEVIHTIRLRAATFRSLCPDPPTALEAWWSGQPPARGATSTFVLLDPTASRRQRVWLDLEGAISRAHPRFRDYADAASRLRGR